MKKLITIVLVLVMLASILVLPAMASEIQPRYPAQRCPLCEGGTTFVKISNGYYYYYCGACNYTFRMPA